MDLLLGQPESMLGSFLGHRIQTNFARAAQGNPLIEFLE